MNFTANSGTRCSHHPHQAAPDLGIWLANEGIAIVDQGLCIGTLHAAGLGPISCHWALMLAKPSAPSGIPGCRKPGIHRHRPCRFGPTAPQGTALRAILEHEVDHARNGIRTILCGGRITQHLDSLQGNCGITLMSGPWAPSETPLPSHEMTAARWRRLPLTRTSVWSAARPRRLAGRMKVAASLIG